MLNQNNITALPTTTGLGGYTKDGSTFYNVGTYTGVSLQYLADLVGGIKGGDDIDVKDVNSLPAYDVDFSYKYITNTASAISSWFNPTTGAAQTPTEPINIIIAYEFNGATLPSSWDYGSLLDMPVGPQGLVSYGEYMCYFVDTIVVDNGNNGAPYLTCNTCNSAGVAQNTFNSGSNVLFKATGLTASTAYNVYVVPYQSSWSTGMAIPTAVSTTSVTTDSSGDLAATNIYTSASPGQYDIVVKASSETDGAYDVQDVLLTNVVATPGSGLFVLPEYAIGGLGALIACFAVFLVYSAFKKNLHLPHFNKHVTS
jgi:hypothetical protein